MKCYIKKNTMYYKQHLGFDICKNHWVAYRQEAKLFDNVAEARKEIKKNKINNVEVIKL